MKINTITIATILTLSTLLLSCTKESYIETDCVKIASATLAGAPETKVSLEADAFVSGDSFLLTDGSSSATYTYDGTSWSYDRPLIWNTFPVTLTATPSRSAPAGRIMRAGCLRCSK